MLSSVDTSGGDAWVPVGDDDLCAVQLPDGNVSRWLGIAPGSNHRRPINRHPNFASSAHPSACKNVEHDGDGLPGVGLVG